MAEETLAGVTHSAAMTALKFLEALIKDPATGSYERQEAAQAVLRHIKEEKS